ncbi:sulfite exporter TauE/SafE family protein [Calditerricola satsumensis]|uniref:Probable membrane transporter protein n=1 Tax=Calditerricola satsumensis TaxID=373054 RepID=A0A8J3BE87_9BACI|nr:sulfite exporter TauE/SafE family protein [Calditerricola satsumensis]GGK02150.1 UPF0721 transmembrane protein [Calditerricola satsumensis]
MEPVDLLVLATLIFVAAALYSSVGHGGASGYLAAMGLLGVAPAVMKPTALILNLLVASLAALQFGRAKAFSWSTFWPFAAGSIPMAYLGGLLDVPPSAYKVLVGLVLLYAAYRLWRRPTMAEKVVRKPPLLLALLAGAGIGFLSGLIGVGGGIFLSPLLLFAGWADPKTTAGVSAAFILVNSAAGLLGHTSGVMAIPPEGVWFVLAAVAGGALGSRWGSRRFGHARMRRLLAVVLVIAGGKMLVA